MVDLGEAGIAEQIKTIGLFRNKAKNTGPVARLSATAAKSPTTATPSKPCPASAARPPTWCSTPSSANRRWP
jgi:hypothetical protein